MYLRGCMPALVCIPTRGRMSLRCYALTLVCVLIRCRMYLRGCMPTLIA